MRWRQRKIAFWLPYFISTIINWFCKKLGRVAPMRHATTLAEAKEFVSSLIWTEDSWKLLGFKLKHSWIKSAEVIQYEYNQGKRKIGDCDEFAIAAARKVRGITSPFVVTGSWLCTIRWTNAEGKVEGHNTAVFRYLTPGSPHVRYGILSNWPVIEGFDSIENAVQHVVLIAKGDIIAYTVADPDTLKILWHVTY